MKNSIIILIAKVVNFIVRLTGHNGGNVVGKIAKKMNPDIIKFFKIDCPIIAVTATNGKTTTNNCIKYILEKNGKKVVSNSEGNNMETGIIATFIKSSNLKGEIDADFVTLEVDESYVPIIFKKIKLDTLLVLDFFRDQLDRNGEVETLILKINEFLKEYDGNLILNLDDPNVARLKENMARDNVFYFSVDKYKYATKNEREAGEGKFCPFDKNRLKYEYYQYSHIGKFACPKCGYGVEEIFLKVENPNVENGTFKIDGKQYESLARSIYTIYNLAGAIAVAKGYGINSIEPVKTFKLDNGRAELVKIKGIDTYINLAKNPTGANVSLRTLNEDSCKKDLLFVLNDKIADGKDVSWIWDINFDVSNVNRIITSGTRCYDMAIRVKTSGFPNSKIEAYSNLDEAVEALYKTDYKKYVIANYTALQPTRKSLQKFKSQAKE